MTTANPNSTSVKKPENTVLLVEDKRVWQQILRDVSKMLGCHTRVASNYSQAIKALREMNFSLAVIDLGLEDDNRLGRLLIQMMNKEFPHIPIIIVSGVIYEGQPEFIEIEENPQVIRIFPKQTLQLNELLQYMEETLLKKERKERILLSPQSSHTGNSHSSLQLSNSTTRSVKKEHASSITLFWGVFLGLIIISSVWVLIAWVMRGSGITSHFGLILASLVSIILIMTFALTVFGTLDKRQLIEIFDKVLDRLVVPDWNGVSRSWETFIKRLRARP